VSKEDAWDQLSVYLTPIDLARFRDALLQALRIADPALDLLPEERWIANVRGHEHPLSTHLREGLIDTLAIMGARSGETSFFTGHTGQWHADDITLDVLNRANADEGAKLWSSLSGVLPLLAGAAPEPFLRTVDDALSRHPSPLVALSTDTGPAAGLFASSPHTGLLWALESLGWSPDYLGLVSQHLATLSRLDPGGRLSNRPFESLRSIFLIWNPQTAAPLSHRLSALDNLRRGAPEIAWRLMLAILPKQHDVLTPSHAPRWRDWKDARAEHVPFEEYRHAIEAVVDRLLDDVGVNGERWSTLIKILDNLPRDRIIAALENIPSRALSDEDRTLVWAALRSVISRHRSFPDADWALSTEVVDRIERVYAGLGPRDPVRRAAWLFARTPDLLEGKRREWPTYHRAVQNAQADAIRALHRDGGIAEVTESLEQLFRRGDLHQSEGIHDIGTLLDYLTTSETTDRSRLAQLEWMFLPLLEGVGRSANVLGEELARNPQFFMDILCLVFRARDEEPREAADEQKARAMFGYQLLDSWRQPPGYRNDGSVDEEALNKWVNVARTLAVAHKREEIADVQIGRVLRYVPNDLDGRWPHRVVRRLVEQIASRSLETGLELELRNSRGVTARGLIDGGAQERAL